MQNKGFKNIISFLLVITLMLGQFGAVGIAQKDDNVMDIISNLSEEDLAKLPELEILAENKIKLSNDVNLDTDKPIKVIIQLKEEPIKIQQLSETEGGLGRSSVDSEKKVILSQENFKTELKNIELLNSVKIKNTFNQVFNGLALTIPANKINELAEIEEVKAIWEDKTIQVEDPVTVDDINMGPRMIDSSKHLELSKLHNEGIKGAGVKVGVLDTGIDYNHPDLKDVYKAGYNYVQESFEVRADNDPMEATYDEWVALHNDNPEEFPEFIGSSAYYTSHGTHVSGTIASQGKNSTEYPIEGVAPEVDLYAYRVLGPYGSGDFSWITKGIDDAAKHGMDVVNLSLGGRLNDPEHPVSIAIDNATRTGMICIIASGNDGPDLYTLGVPGTSPLATTVGASTSSMSIPTFDSSYEGFNFNMKLFSREFKDDLSTLPGNEFELVDLALGKPEDFDGIDLEGKTAFIQRGEIPFYDKIQNAKAAGASNVIIWNNEDGEIENFFGENDDLLLTFAITKADGSQIKSKLSEGKKVSIDANGAPSVITGDELAEFSSRGPTAKTYGIKPDIVAPGVDVLSTVPGFINSKEDNTNYTYAYSRMSGTSMATPHITGIVALMKQHNPNISPDDVKSALMNNAKDLNGAYSLFDSGAGRVDAYKTVKSDFMIKVLDNWKEVDYETGSIRFDSTYNSGQAANLSKELLIENKRSGSVNLTTRVEFLDGSIRGVADGNVNNLSLSIDGNISVPANSSIKVNANLLVPDGVEEGIYQGFIFFESDGNEEFRVPFSVRISDKGVRSYEIINKAYFADKFHPFIGPRWAVIGLEVKSPMKDMHLILKDGKTEEIIGYIGRADLSYLDPDKDSVHVGFDGRYVEFVGNPSDLNLGDTVIADEGFYKIEAYISDEDGNQYVEIDDMFYDKTPPIVTMNEGEDSGVYEISDKNVDGDGVIWFHGKVYDPTVDLMSKNGYPELNQSNNTVVYYQNSDSPSGFLRTDSEGNFKFGVDKAEVEGGETINLNLFTYAYSTAGDFGDRLEYFFIKEGNEYSTIRPNKKIVGSNDVVKLTLGTKYVKELDSVEFTLDSMYDFGDIERVQINKHMQEYAEDNNLKLKLEKNIGRNSTIKLTVEGEAKDKIDEAMDMIDVFYKVAEIGMDTAPRFNIKNTRVTKDGTSRDIENGFTKFGVRIEEEEIRNIKPNVDKNLRAGEKVKVSFEATPGGIGIFSIDLLDEKLGKVKVQMNETSPGKYEGTWTVPQGLEGKILEIGLSYKDSNGEETESKGLGLLSIAKLRVEEPEEKPELPSTPNIPTTPEKPGVPGEKPEKPEEKPEKPEEPKEPEEKPEKVELTDKEVEKILKDSYKDRKDIPNWAEKAIATLTDGEVVSGRADGRFDPSANVSRAEFLKMLVESLELEKDTNKIKDFKDVKSSDWFKTYIDIGVSNGLASGISKTQFGPNLKITRQDLSVMVYNAIKDLKLDSGNVNIEFKNEDEISDYAKEAVNELAKLGVVTGKSEGVFDPKAEATRAEASVIIYRVLELMSK